MWYVSKDKMIKENFEELKNAFEELNFKFINFEIYLNEIRKQDRYAYASYVAGTSLKLFENYAPPYRRGDLIGSVIQTVIHEELHDILYRIDGYTASVGLDYIDIQGEISGFNLDEI